MKKLLLLLLFPIISLAQTQVGGDIDGISSFDYSGSSVAIAANGSIIAVGCINKNKVTVYKNISGVWTQLGATIIGVGNDNAGKSVSLSSDGTVLAVGAITSGHTRIYKYISGTWTQVGTDIVGAEYSGNSVSLSADGTIVAIGAPYADGSAVIDSGVVYLYRNVAGTWTQIGLILGESAGDLSGISVSLSSNGTVVAIGAYNNDGNGSNSGQVRVYKNISGTWTQIGSDINGEAAEDFSGNSVSLSSDGNIVAIGAPKNDGNGDLSGHVRVYRNNSGTWTKIGADIDGSSSQDRSGTSVSLSANGNVVAIGAPYYGDSGNSYGVGQVRLFVNVSGTWTQIGSTIYGEAYTDNSGTSIALSPTGNIVAIAAISNNGIGLNDCGHVRVFNISQVLASDQFVQANFKCYPNPTSETVTIEINENLQLETVNIYTSLGQLVKSEKNKEISVTTFAKGTYYFEIVTNLGKATKTIVVE